MTDLAERGDTQARAAVSRIPLRNIWLLLLYASSLFRHHGRSMVAAENNPEEIPALVARILLHEVEQRLLRQLSMGYQTRRATLNRVRGRIDVLRTTSRQMLERAQVACLFQEMTLDTPRNRYVRSALEHLVPLLSDGKLAAQCRAMAVNLRRRGIEGAMPSKGELPSITRFGRHDAADKAMVDAAQLAFELWLPTQTAGQKLLPTPSDDPYWMRKLFEKSMAGFYHVHLPKKDWTVAAGKELKWRLTSHSAGSESIFPTMNSDIILEHRQPAQRIIIDTKFNNILIKGWYRDQSLRSGYIYQMYTYLRTQENRTDQLSLRSAGLLLHPAVDVMLSEFVEVQGHKIHFATVDLAADAVTMTQQLLKLAHDCCGIADVN